MSLDPAARRRIAAALGRDVVEASPLGGGDIAAVWRLRLDGGALAVAKLGAGLAIEGWMLRWLARESAAPVPQVQLAADDLLVMDHLDGTPGAGAAEEHLAAIVASLHDHAGPAFGFERDTMIGGLPQPNPWTDDWLAFFRDHRLLDMARRAHAAGRLPKDLLARIEILAGRLERWIAADSRPSLVHGDLWSGNILARGERIVGLLDPAIHYADPEIELAFMTLFGSVGDRFFAAYAERRKMRPGFFEARRDLYNLFPLLVHVRLFGGAYVRGVAATLSRFGC